jgi:glucose-6-phosphate isomerase/transaldolase/glucose-6-phosphate isomerase
VRTFLVNASARSYVALQAYVPPRAATARALSQLREAVRDASDGRATTVGFGPRFLHSTGQLHKGDAGLGLFIQLIAQPTEDLDIPDAAGSSDSSLSFGTLINAQAAGDRQALLNAKRPVLTLRLEAGREPEEIRSLADRLIS